MSAGESDPTRREVIIAGATRSAVSRPMERTGFGQRWSTPFQLWRLGGGLREVKDPSTRTGDQKFSTALIANLPALRRYAVALVSSVAQADELVLGCIERALRESAQLREIPRIAGSLRRILHNLYVDELHPSHARSKEEDVSELADQLELCNFPTLLGGNPPNIAIERDSIVRIKIAGFVERLIPSKKGRKIAGGTACRMESPTDGGTGSSPPSSCFPPPTAVRCPSFLAP
jgi:hypothetical protein